MTEKLHRQTRLPCQVDETTEREEGWLYGSKQGKMGWFPESYVERVSQSHGAAASTTSAPPAAAAAAAKIPLMSQLSNALEAAKAAGAKSAFTPTHSTNPTPSEAQVQVGDAWRRCRSKKKKKKKSIAWFILLLLLVIVVARVGV